jgi:hypothetical protein
MLGNYANYGEIVHEAFQVHAPRQNHERANKGLQMAVGI